MIKVPIKKEIDGGKRVTLSELAEGDWCITVEHKSLCKKFAPIDGECVIGTWPTMAGEYADGDELVIPVDVYVIAEAQK